MLAFLCGNIILRDGTVEKDYVLLVDNGKIAALGKGIAIPDGAEVIDCTDQWVSPGLIDPATKAGINREPLGMREDEIRDGGEFTDMSHPLLHVADAFDPETPVLNLMRNAGFSAAFCEPGGNSLFGANLVGGQGMAFKLKRAAHFDEIMIPGTEQMCINLGEPVKTVAASLKKFPQTRMGQMEFLRSELREAQEGTGRKAAVWKKVLHGEMRARIAADMPVDITNAIRLGEEFSLNYMLESLFMGVGAAEAIHKAGVPCIVIPAVYGLLGTDCSKNMPRLDNAAQLEKTGCEISFTQREATVSRSIPYTAGIAVAHGYSKEGARRAMTICAARSAGIDAITGSLEVGKDADIAVFSGDPILNTSRCTTLYIKGIRQFEI